jgi:hypothetical protein
MGQVTPSPPRPWHRALCEQGYTTTDKSLIVPDLSLEMGEETPCSLQIRFAEQEIETKTRHFPESDLKDSGSTATNAKYLALRLAFPELQQHDVLLGRSPTYYSQPGNQRFLKVLKPTYQALYKAALKAEKRGIAQRMVNEVYELGGRFMKCEEEGSPWFEVSNEVAREKAAQTLREDLSQAERQVKRALYPKKRSNPRVTPRGRRTLATTKRLKKIPADAREVLQPNCWIDLSVEGHRVRLKKC